MEHMETREIGRVYYLHPNKYGFLRSNGKHLFFHYSELNCNFEDLTMYSLLEYTIAESPKGPLCKNVVVIEDALYDKHRMKKKGEK